MVPSLPLIERGQSRHRLPKLEAAGGERGNRSRTGTGTGAGGGGMNDDGGICAGKGRVRRRGHWGVTIVSSSPAPWADDAGWWPWQHEHVTLRRMDWYTQTYCDVVHVRRARVWPGNLCSKETAAVCVRLGTTLVLE